MYVRTKLVQTATSHVLLAIKVKMSNKVGVKFNAVPSLSELHLFGDSAKMEANELHQQSEKTPSRKETVSKMMRTS